MFPMLNVNTSFKALKMIQQAPTLIRSISKRRHKAEHPATL